MKLRSPLARVRGLGSAREGTHHFWAQRISALALVPLCVWFVVSLVAMTGLDHAAALAWARQPLVALLLVAFVIAVFYHAQLGMQVVLEDYLHNEWLKVASIVALRLVTFLLGAAALLAVLRIALGKA